MITNIAQDMNKLCRYFLISKLCCLNKKWILMQTFDFCHTFYVGECSCNTGYIGTDCSVFTRIPPNDTSIPEEGLCRKSIRRCQKTNIMGLFYSEIIHVRFGYFVVSLRKFFFFLVLNIGNIEVESLVLINH